MSEKLHSDDIAVDAFAALMKAKLKKKRGDGRGGWEECRPHELAKMLCDHLDKGDPVDIANFCMFISSIGTSKKVVRDSILDALQDWITASTEVVLVKP